MDSVSGLLDRYREWAEERERLSNAEAAPGEHAADWSDSDDEGSVLAHELAAALLQTFQARCPCFVLSDDGWCHTCGKQWKAVGR